jgi:hypothetical protein
MTMTGLRAREGHPLLPPDKNPRGKQLGRLWPVEIALSLEYFHVLLRI